MIEDTKLLRQINSSWIQEGRVTSQAFRPTPKDESKLSTYNGDQISPEAAWMHYTKQLKLTSIGVMAVTCQECNNQNLQVVHDGVPFQEHVYIDYSGITNNQIKAKGAILTSQARKRGWLYRCNASE